MKDHLLLFLQAPEPSDPWTETLDAFEHMATCMHTNNPPFSDKGEFEIRRKLSQHTKSIILLYQL